MGVVDSIKNYLIGITIKKGLKEIVKVAIGLLTSAGVVSLMGKYGIDVKVDPLILEGGLAALITGLLESVRNVIKQKFPAIGKYL